MKPASFAASQLEASLAALLERVRFYPEGQPVSATLMDYLAPTAAEMCAVDIVHLETPSKFSETGGSRSRT